MYKRGKTFLNNSFKEGGSIMWEVGNEGWRDYREAPSDSIIGKVTITDCSKAIHLDLDCDSLEKVPSRVLKLNTLINELTKAKETLESIYENRIKKKKYYY